MNAIIGIDYGQSFTGLSLATSAIAEPLRTVPTSDLKSTLVSLIRQHKPDLLVFGLPENTMATTIKSKALSLSEQLHIRVEFQDETLSSQETRLKLAKLGKKKSVREGKIDHFVAAGILQDYLDKTGIFNPNTSKPATMK